MVHLIIGLDFFHVRKQGRCVGQGFCFHLWFAFLHVFNAKHVRLLAIANNVFSSGSALIWVPILVVRDLPLKRRYMSYFYTVALFRFVRRFFVCTFCCGITFGLIGRSFVSLQPDFSKLDRSWSTVLLTGGGDEDDHAAQGYRNWKNLSRDVPWINHRGRWSPRLPAASRKWRYSV